MQFRVKDYNEAIHAKWTALTVSQPDADYLCFPVCRRNNGEWVACKTSIELPFKTNYRGDILIVSGASKYPQTHPSEQTRGLVHLDSITRTDDGLYIWQFSDPRRVVEYPAKGPRGKLWSYICPKDEITPYPRYIKVK